MQNFRAKPAIPMAHWPEPSRGEMLRAVAVARLLMPNVNIQAPPNLSAPYYEDLLDAGINDWGGISPLTPDFINPEKPWPHLEQLRLRTEAKGFAIAPAPAGLSGILPELMSRARIACGKTASRTRSARSSQEKEGRMICVLTGGTGGAKFVDGLRQVMPAEEITLIVNTGDDLLWWGLYVSPDIDSITYVLSGMLSRERGWGVKGDTFLCLQAMGQLGRAHLVPHRRPRSRHAPAAFATAGRRQDAFRSHRDHLRQTGSEGAHSAHERFAGRDPRGYARRAN